MTLEGGSIGWAGAWDWPHFLSELTPEPELFSRGADACEAAAGELMWPGRDSTDDPAIVRTSLRGSNAHDAADWYTIGLLSDHRTKGEGADRQTLFAVGQMHYYLAARNDPLKAVQTVVLGDFVPEGGAHVSTPLIRTVW